MFVGSIALGAVLVIFALMLGMSSAATWIGAAWGGELLVYAVACAAASLPFSGTLDLPALLMLPAVMAVYHVAYGCGFLIGLLKPERAQSGGTAPVSVFTELTR